MNFESYYHSAFEGMKTRTSIFRAAIDPVSIVLGGRLGKKYWRIDCSILGAHGNIYRSHLVKKNRGPYLIKFWAQWP